MKKFYEILGKLMLILLVQIVSAYAILYIFENCITVYK